MLLVGTDRFDLDDPGSHMILDEMVFYVEVLDTL